MSLLLSWGHPQQREGCERERSGEGVWLLDLTLVAKELLIVLYFDKSIFCFFSCRRKNIFVSGAPREGKKGQK